jgi:asparagine synthase (glutamine-hydrolysing)
MCGIAGIVNTNPGLPVEQAAVQHMCQIIEHRGPDDQGTYVRNGVGLGIRRLSIIDLPGGRQPIHNEDKSVWVVFNGEIYNFDELRSELQGAGHQFYTNTDTEVIVHLYEAMGRDCVHKLRGMFAFAVYDQRRNYLLLARDRLGKKPLHYAVHEGRLLFGSEIKSLLSAAPELAEVNREAILQYFYFGYILDPLTAFRDICKLPPGHTLELFNGQVTVRRYWDLPPYGTADSKSEPEYLDELERQVDQAVRIRLVSDVPLGALLSGGVDSSTVVALMARSMSKPVKTFTISFGPQDFDESNAARIISQRFGTEHHELVVEPHISEDLEALTCSLEEPFADSSILPTYYVSRLTRKHVTVALAGDGGDELFAGYRRYAVNLSRRAFDWVPLRAGAWYRDFVYPWLPSGVWGRKFLFNASLPQRDRYLDSLSYLPVLQRDRAIFSEEYLESLDRFENPVAAYRKYFDDAPAETLLSRLLYLDTKTYLAGDILTKVDRMSMMASLEVRAPLLDHHVVEWAARLPETLKLQGSRSKYLLRKLAERVGVPKEVLDRPKHGFALPLVHWMRSELKGGLVAILSEPRTLQRGYFNPKAVRRLLEEHWSGRRDHSGEIWMLLMFELWHRNFLSRTAADKSTLVPAGETNLDWS